MEVALTPDDDGFHAPLDDNWWFHETCWFWFFVAERSLGGWLYNYIRPNAGLAGGGCWIWDASAFLHWEVPYYANYSNLPLPVDRDLRDFTFPSGVHVRAVEALRRYELRYADRDALDLALEYVAIDEPWLARGDDGRPPHHFDQLGRVTGSITLHGETIAVDCLAIRDRTWTTRHERWRHGGGYGYTNAAAPTGEAFLAVGDDDVRGYLTLDGHRAALTGGKRVVERDPEHGYVTRVTVTGTDEAGRTLHADGTPVSRMAMPIPGVHGVVWTSLVRWTLNGASAWGEDQEPWPVMTWSTRRRSGLL